MKGGGMATSTGIVVAAGAVAMTDLVVNDWDAVKAIRLCVGTTLAAFVAAGLDNLLAGFGTGLAVLLLMSAILRNGPKIINKLFPT